MNSWIPGMKPKGLDEIVKCDKAHIVLVSAWREPYCISSTRQQPVPIALHDRQTYDTFCCSPNFKRCPYYRPSIITLLIKGGKLAPPTDA